MFYPEDEVLDCFEIIQKNERLFNQEGRSDFPEDIEYIEEEDEWENTIPFVRDEQKPHPYD